MPPFRSRKTWLALDMAGCPNRCRHCWLGFHPNRMMAEQDLRRVVALFRNWTRASETVPFFERVDAMTWWREPDFADNYRALYDLERELNGERPKRFELFSVWRLARDESYAPWAKTVGTRACQITFFGTEETTDWFHRRKGAFHDNLLATERLLDAGIVPRWQLIFTKKIVPELGDLLKIVDRMRLRERTASLGGQFVIFLHTPCPDGEAWNIEHLRPTINDLTKVPAELKECSERHLGAPIGEAEGSLVPKIMEEKPVFPSAYGYPELLSFYVTSQLDVFSNMGDLSPWWKLGNLNQDGVGSIIDRFENDKVPGLHVIHNVSAADKTVWAAEKPALVCSE